jgi:hypothetical protein
MGMREGSEQVGAGFIFSLQLFCRARYFSANESAMVLTPPDLANGKVQESVMKHLFDGRRECYDRFVRERHIGKCNSSDRGLFACASYIMYWHLSMDTFIFNYEKLY